MTPLTTLDRLAIAARVEGQLRACLLAKDAEIDALRERIARLGTPLDIPAWLLMDEGRYTARERELAIEAFTAGRDYQRVYGVPAAAKEDAPDDAYEIAVAALPLSARPTREQWERVTFTRTELLLMDILREMRAARR